MNIFIIPEDFRYDQLILKPLFSRLVKTISSRPNNVRVCQDPLLGGVTEALKSERIEEIIQQYQGRVDLFILCVDRDGEIGRRQRLDQLEAQFGPTLLAENAWEEIETWVLAGLDLPTGWRWAEVRAERDVKERHFTRLGDDRGLAREPDIRRKILANEASRRILAIRQKCPEDFDYLARRLQAALT